MGRLLVRSCERECRRRGSGTALRVAGIAKASGTLGRMRSSKVTICPQRKRA